MNGLAPRVPTAADRERMLAEHVEQVEARDLGQRNAQARRIGPIALATVGMEAWSRFGDEPRGGVIVEISETLDKDTGELARVFLTLNPYRAPDRWECSLPESEVTENTFEIPTTARLVKMAVRLAVEIAKVRGNLATPRMVRYSKYQHELLVVSMGGGR